MQKNSEKDFCMFTKKAGVISAFDRSGRAAQHRKCTSRLWPKFKLYLKVVAQAQSGMGVFHCEYLTGHISIL